MRIKIFCSAIVLVALAGCASTHFKSTWKAPDAGPVALTGKKILVLATGVPTAVRTSVESAAVDELNKNGAMAMASSQFLAPNTTTEAAKAKLAAEGYDAAWVIRMTNREQEVSSTPGMYTPMYGSYWGMYGGYYGGMYGAPEIHTDIKVYIETLLYSVAHDKLAWSGMSVTTNPNNLTASASELTRIALAEMKKTGLLQ